MIQHVYDTTYSWYNISIIQHTYLAHPQDIDPDNSVSKFNVIVVKKKGYTQVHKTLSFLSNIQAFLFSLIKSKLFAPSSPVQTSQNI